MTEPAGTLCLYGYRSTVNPITDEILDEAVQVPVPCQAAAARRVNNHST